MAYNLKKNVSIHHEIQFTKSMSMRNMAVHPVLITFKCVFLLRLNGGWSWSRDGQR